MLTLLARLDRTRFDLHLVVLTGQGPLAGLCPDDVAVTDLNCARLRHALPALRRAVNRIGPDIVVSTMGYLNLAVLGLRPWLAGRPKVVVREANALSATIGGGIRGRTMKAAYRLLYPRAEQIICPASFIRDELRSLGVRTDRIKVIYNPVDEAALRMAAARPERQSGPGRRFVAAGRLTHQKGFDRLVDWVAGLDEQDRVTVFGDGGDREALIDRTRERGVSNRIGFPGFANPIAPWIAGADAFVLPSRWEGMPNAALEALALGTPVIATPEAGGISEIRDLAGAGVTIARDGPAFVSAMAQVRGEPVGSPRKSLLPEAFRIGSVVEDVERLLGGHA